MGQPIVSLNMHGWGRTETGGQLVLRFQVNDEKLIHFFNGCKFSNRYKDKSKQASKDLYLYCKALVTGDSSGASSKTRCYYYNKYGAGAYNQIYEFYWNNESSDRAHSCLTKISNFKSNLDSITTSLAWDTTSNIFENAIKFKLNAWGRSRGSGNPGRRISDIVVLLMF